MQSHMCWQWIWVVELVSSPDYWHPTSRRWWALMWVRLSWRRPELCQATPTSHTGTKTALYLDCLLMNGRTVTCVLYLQEGKRRGSSFSKWFCGLDNSIKCSPLLWQVKVYGWGKPSFKAWRLHRPDGLHFTNNKTSLPGLWRKTHWHNSRGELKKKKAIFVPHLASFAPLQGQSLTWNIFFLQNIRLTLTSRF